MTGVPQTNDQLEPMWQAVPLGTNVYANDGDVLGTVEQIRENGLIVKGDGARDKIYVVTPQDISRIEQDGVHLLVGHEEAMRAQASPPGA
jgi:hypothetical protein